ncbi:hypothetical protein D3C81_1054500 [compost metagenome]
MPAQQRSVNLGHATLAKLLAQRRIDSPIAGHHHQPGRAEIQAVHEGAARENLHQSIMHRVEILRIFPRKAQQPRRFVDQHQMCILIENFNLVETRRGNKGIDNRRHQAARIKSGSG